MTRERRLVVLGAGGHAKVVVATARQLGYSIDAVYDDDESRWGGSVLGVTIRGPLEAAAQRDHPAVLAVGDNRIRRRLAAQYDLDWATLVDPRAAVDPTSPVGAGTVVFAGAVVQPDCAIGSHVILNTACTVDHDCAVADLAHIAPGSHLGGGVTVGEGSLVGLGSAIVPMISIGAWATVGAGSVVIRDVTAGATVCGSPARSPG